MDSCAEAFKVANELLILSFQSSFSVAKRVALWTMTSHWQLQNPQLYGMQSITNPVPTHAPLSHNGYSMNIQQQSTYPPPHGQPQQCATQPPRHLMPQIVSNRYVPSHTFNYSHPISYNVIPQHNVPQSQYYPTPMHLPLYPAIGSTVNHRVNVNYHPFRGHVQQQQHMNPHPPQSIRDQSATTMYQSNAVPNATVEVIPHRPQNANKSNLLVIGFVRHFHGPSNFRLFPNDVVRIIFDFYYLAHGQWMGQTISIEVMPPDPENCNNKSPLYLYSVCDSRVGTTSERARARAMWRMYPKSECSGFTLRPVDRDDINKVDCITPKTKFLGIFPK